MKLLLLALSVCSCSADFPPGIPERLADAIFLAEGGHRSRTPYGIKNCPDPQRARQTCLRLIQEAGIDWELAWKKRAQQVSFIEFLGQTYCPPKAHRLNEHWSRNVAFHYRKLTKADRLVLVGP